VPPAAAALRIRPGDEHVPRLLALPLGGNGSIASSLLSDVREHVKALRTGAEIHRRGGSSPCGALDLVPSEPSLRFDSFGIVLHFVADDEQMREAMKARLEAAVEGRQGAPNPFTSFAEDIVKYEDAPHRQGLVYQPLRARRIMPGERRASSSRTSPPSPVGAAKFVSAPLYSGCALLDLPTETEFQSEGRRRRFHLPLTSMNGDERKVRVRVRSSITWFPDTDIMILNLALVESEVDEGGPLDEYDLILLTKLWQGGESTADLVEHVTLDKCPVGAYARKHFLSAASSSDTDASDHALEVRAGTIQLITPGGDDAQDWRRIWMAIAPDAGEEQKEDSADDLRLMRKAPFDKLPTPLGRQTLAVAGIVQGLLDFEAVDAEELGEVFEPHQIDEDGFCGIHKGTLLTIGDTDRAYEAARDKIGVSPYALLPQVVLLHNEELLDQVLRTGDSVRARPEATNRLHDPATAPGKPRLRTPPYTWKALSDWLRNRDTKDPKARPAERLPQVAGDANPG
jgi:hypothetical protein